MIPLLSQVGDGWTDDDNDKEEEDDDYNVDGDGDVDGDGVDADADDGNLNSVNGFTCCLHATVLIYKENQNLMIYINSNWRRRKTQNQTIQKKTKITYVSDETRK